MNRVIQCSICALMVMSVIGCARMQELEGLKESIDLTITAIREDTFLDTKTARLEDGSVVWSPMDEISLFYGKGANGGSKFTSQNTEEVAITEFKGRIEGVSGGGEEFTGNNYFWGVYPYSPSNSCDGNSITTSLPAFQTAAEGTFASNLFLTMARSKGLELAFYNVCGGVKFSVSRSDITAVRFKGNANETLAGTVKIAFNEMGKPEVTEVIDGKKEVTVYAPGGGTFEAGKYYYIILLPSELSDGFTMSFRTNELKEGAYVRSTSVNVLRSSFGVLNQPDKDVTAWDDATITAGGGHNGIYLGINGFNQQLYNYPLSILNDLSKQNYDSFIDGLTMKNGTLLYYSVDQAISTLKHSNFPEDLCNVAIVTFTDGLDQGSLMYNDNYLTDEEYLSALHDLISNTTIQGISLSSYAIGVRGSDVTDINKFQQNLQLLATTPSNAYEVTDISEVNSKFQSIADELSKTTFSQTLALTMPGTSHGTIVRFTFDNIVSADKSELFIEGTFNLKDKKLDNIVYHGLTSSSGLSVQGEVINGIMVRFKFEDVITDNNEVIQPNAINQWLFINSTSSWQINSEFEREEDVDLITNQKTAVIMLVVDCSSSLGADFDYLKTAAKSFVSTLCLATPMIDDPNISYGYSTTPFDLALVVKKDGVFYYLSPYDYNRAGGVPDGYTGKGVVVMNKERNFWVALHDYYKDDQTQAWSNSNAVLGNAPDIDIARLIVSRWGDINQGLGLYGGRLLSGSYWSKTSNYNFDTNRTTYYSFSSSGIQTSVGVGADSSSARCKLRGAYEIGKDRL